MPELAVAVRDLVRFCYRGGDIDHRFTPSPSGPEGIAGHQHLYRRRPDSYRPEYPVALVEVLDDMTLTLRGRADGFDPERAVVEEIKTCRCDFDSIPEAVSRQHRSQAALYAALICREAGLAGLTVRLTWLNIDSGEERSEQNWLARRELEAFLQETLGRFSRWLRLLSTRRERRDQSIRALPFPPGDFRPGQREMAELVYKCIDQAGRLMLEAPTGIGKTAAVLYPAVKALAAGKHDRVAFLTSKTVGRLAAEEALALFATAGYRGGFLTLTARERICFSPGKACHGDDCPFARGYYDRLPQAMEAALAEPRLRRAEIEALAQRFRICPYQLQLDLLPWIELVIADVHYAFSLYPLLGGGSPDERCSLLLDEAHNLPDRARDMYSAELVKGDLMAARRSLPRAQARRLDRINRQLLALRKSAGSGAGEQGLAEVPETLQRALQGFVAETGGWLAEQPDILQRHPPLGDFYFAVLHFQRVLEYWGDEFRLQLRCGPGVQDLKLELRCLDPARVLAERAGACHSLTAFSATLSPASWMRQSLGLPDDTVCRRLDSPFDPGQLAVHIATGVDTRYRQRRQSLPALAGLLAEWLRPGRENGIVYFPSYHYLQETVAQLRERGLEQWGLRTWVQSSGQDQREREELLSWFATEEGVIAFCILGGVFGEGIDLPGKQLSRVAIVGVGLPAVSPESEQLRDWYQQRYGAGFEYAYLYPGLQKVSQALGRVIRDGGDRGRALLIDSRFGRSAYRELLPPWWQYRAWPPNPDAAG